MSGNDQYFSVTLPVMDTAATDVYVRIGFTPDVVRLTNLYNGISMIWNRAVHGHYQGATASGGLAITATGGIALGAATAGLCLCKFIEPATDLTHGGAVPATVDGTNWIDANGIKIAWVNTVLTDDTMLMVEAWRMNYILLKAYHDGTTNSNTYFEDSSYDFRELGVCGNGKWLIYNQTNTDYAYIKSVNKPAGKTKWCRLYTATDAAGTATTAADFDTSDVCYIFPIDAAPYPMTMIGITT
uniref:Uncharacterized protein n=1 Tax=viral metagenome TaxID=1070528 RepID=A0A6M3ID61_9ZZZZ